VTPETVRVEVDGAGVVFEEEAVLALAYDARREDASILDWGRRALTVPERLGDIDLLDPRKRRPAIVPVEEARWLDGDRGLGAPPAAKFNDPWEHHGEIVLVRPWAPGLGSIRTWAWVLYNARLAFLNAGAATGLGAAQRFRLRHGAAVDVVLPELPADAKDHDRLVRVLWDIFGSRVWLGGAPARLRNPPGLRWRDRLAAAAWLGAALFPIGLRISRGLRPLNAATALIGAVFIGAAYLGLSAAARRDPSAVDADGLGELLRKLRRRVTDPGRAGVAPAGCTGAGDFRFGVTQGGGWMVVPLLVLAPILVRVFDLVAPHRGRACPAPGRDTTPWYVILSLGIGTLVACGLALWLGYWLTSARLSLGERGLTVRPSGWFSRPQRIPYASIRHAAYSLTLKGQQMRLLLHDGREVSFGFPPDTSRAASEAQSKLLLDIEAKITAHLATAGSYRTPGAADGGPRHERPRSLGRIPAS
jgi:hypothetical protein